MGAVTVKSTAISNADQLFPRLPVPTYLGNGDMLVATGVATVGVGDTAGSIYRLCRVSSGSRIHEMKITNTAMAGCTSCQVGVYRTADQSGNAGASVSAALFGTGIDLSVAQTEPYDVIFNNLGIENVEKRVWELLGLTSDPQVLYDVTIKSVTQSGAVGTLSMILAYAI